MNDNRWLLPEGIEEILPPQAEQLEQLRRRLLDLFRSWGYELIFPPFIEYLDSLLTGTGKDLDIQTFKLTDQASGRLMGVRADITPQAARIDAHQLKRNVPTRLCYLGTSLHTRSDGFGRSRAPVQIGAELFGHHGIESDCEVLCLMMAMLSLAGVEDIHLDLGHVGIFRGLSRQANLDRQQEQALFEALQRKAVSEIESLLNEFGISGAIYEMLAGLAELNGPDALERAGSLLSGADRPVKEALSYLRQTADLVHSRLPDVPVHYDLAELRAYHYQTGVVFAAFVPGSGHEIARGGRYDHIGEAFGRSRPATGFSADLLTLMRHSAGVNDVNMKRILAPSESNARLSERIAELRGQGHAVVGMLPGQPEDNVREMGCTDRLVRAGEDWILKSVD